MQALVTVRGDVDNLDLWPYVRRAERVGAHSLLTLEVHDGRELVGALVAFSQRSLEIVTVETVDPASRTLGNSEKRPAT